MDGERAGKIRSIQKHGFVVTREQSRGQKLVLPYSSISVIGNSIVTLSANRSDVLRRHLFTSDEVVSKRTFINVIDRHLGLKNVARSERITRVTLLLLGRRFTVDQKRRLRRGMPDGVRSLWSSRDRPEVGRAFDMREFLLAIKKQGRFRKLDEAFTAASSVFAALKMAIPPVEALEISRSLPRGLQEIWDNDLT